MAFLSLLVPRAATDFPRDHTTSSGALSPVSVVSRSLTEEEFVSGGGERSPPEKRPRR